MDSSTAVQIISASLNSGAFLAGPPLLIAVAMGLVIAILQASMQLQEQTFSVLVKTVFLFVYFYLLWSPVSKPLLTATLRSFASFARLPRW